MESKYSVDMCKCYVYAKYQYNLPSGGCQCYNPPYTPTLAAIEGTNGQGEYKRWRAERESFMIMVVSPLGYSY